MTDKTDEPCMICFDTLLEHGPKKRLYCMACHKPTCVSCQNEYELSVQSVGMGCVGCRSTSDALYVVWDYGAGLHVTLRLNGDHMRVNISDRALRLASRDVKNMQTRFVESVGDRIISQDKFMCKLVRILVRVINSFLSHEITQNARAKAMVGDRLECPYGEKGVPRIHFAYVE